MRKFLFLLLLPLLLFTSKNLEASHAAGLEITYSPSPGQPGCYIVTVNFYRSCELGAIAAPTSMFLNITSASCNQTLASVNATQISSSVVEMLCPGFLTTCDGGPTPGYEKYTYEAIVCLPMECDDWIISTDECCRNGAITNLQNPAGDWIYVETLLNNTQPFTDNNSSPVFNDDPVAVLCDGQTTCYSNSAYDADGDSLFYELIDPLGQGAVPVLYNAPLSGVDPFNPVGSTVFSNSTGDICITPIGPQVTVLAVRVEEWRDDPSGTPILIGSIIRDIQITVIPCPGNDVPTLPGIDGSTNITNLDTTICPGTNLNLSFTANDVNGDDLYIEYDDTNLPPNANFTVIGNQTPNATGNLVWTPGINDMNNTYSLVVTANDSACPIPATFTLTYTITVSNVDPTLSVFNDICENEAPIALNQGSPVGGNYIGTGVVNGFFDPQIAGPGTHTITYDVTNSIGCSGSASQDITIEAMPNAGIDAAITKCDNEPSFDMFNLLGGNPQNNGVWTDINGVPASNIFNPNNQISNTFKYSVGGTVCPNDESFVDVTVNQLPFANANNDTIICGPNYIMNAIPSIGIGTWTVNSPNIQIFDINNPNTNITANEYGVYTFTWQEDNNNCITNDDIVIDFVQPPFQTVISPPYSNLCPGDSVILSVEDIYQSYQWFWNGNTIPNSNNPSIIEDRQGQYTVEVKNSICTVLSQPSTIDIKDPLSPRITTIIDEDSLICPVSDPFTLEVETPGGLWEGIGVNQDGIFNPSNASQGSNKVFYTLDFNCDEKDSIEIILDCPLEIFVPNAFTPNNDEHNDFLLIFGNNVLEFEFKVYSRWGEIIYSTQMIDGTNISDENLLLTLRDNWSNNITTEEEAKKSLIGYWSGEFNGTIVPNGVYSYTISAFGKDGEVLNKQGVISVIR